MFFPYAHSKFSFPASCTVMLFSYFCGTKVLFFFYITFNLYFFFEFFWVLRPSFLLHGVVLGQADGDSINFSRGYLANYRHYADGVEIHLRRSTSARRLPLCCSHDYEYKGTTFFARFQIISLDLEQLWAQNRWIRTKSNFVTSNP